MKVFVICTAVVVIVLAVIVGAVWCWAPRQASVHVSAVCYGYLLGWLGAWWASYYWSRRITKRQNPLNASP